MKKLVRDKIPEIIRKSGKACSFTQLDTQKTFYYLMKKLTEEVFEFQAAENDEEWLEELADVQEVIYALLEAKGKTKDCLENKREEKKARRGGFEKGILLNTVEHLPD